MTQIQVGQGGISSHIDGLKLALLLDADIVYVDRLYNKELAAEMAFAALGGKTILTSLLAHDAPSTVVKLLETGVDPVIVASSLCGFVCQRLIRVLCPRCKQETEMPKTLQKLLPPDLAQKKVFAPLGCEGCNGTGYYGRTLITEFLPDSQILRQMIVNKQSYRDFKNLAKKQGIKSLETKAMQLVLEGETSPDEYMRLF